MFGGASTGLALLLGVAFGNIIQGVPIDSAGNMSITFVDLLNPFALLFGVTTVVMFALQGSLYLLLKTEGRLQERIRALVPRHRRGHSRCSSSWWPSPCSSTDRQIVQQAGHPRHLAAHLPGRRDGSRSVACWSDGREGRDCRAFLVPRLMIALLLIAGGIGLYPNLLISTTDAAYSLTTTNAAAADNTLQVVLIVALIGMPVRAAVHQRRVLHLPGQGGSRARGLLNRISVTMT